MELIKDKDKIIMSNDSVCGITNIDNLDLKGFEKTNIRDFIIVCSDEYFDVYRYKNGTTIYSKTLLENAIAGFMQFYLTKKQNIYKFLLDADIYYKEDCPIVIQVGDYAILVAPRIEDEI